MTDADTIRAMLDKADIRYTLAAPRPGDDEIRPGTVAEIIVGDYERAHGEHRGEGNLGYTGFFTIFGFDRDGTLISVGAWE